jgi:hypothetical protein
VHDTHIYTYHGYKPYIHAHICLNHSVIYASNSCIQIIIHKCFIHPGYGRSHTYICILYKKIHTQRQYRSCCTKLLLHTIWIQNLSPTYRSYKNENICTPSKCMHKMHNHVHACVHTYLRAYIHTHSAPFKLSRCSKQRISSGLCQNSQYVHQLKTCRWKSACF